jgi:cytoskeletal protein RodZ
MDILVGMLAYVAGIGALVAGLAISFSVFVATPKEPLQAQNQPQSASAMLVRPSPASTPKKSTVVAAQTKQGADQSEKHAAAVGSPGATQPPASARNRQRRPAAAVTAQVRRLNQEERARRLAYHQDSSFESRFLGYAD